MTTNFKVGQRVRIVKVYYPENRHLIGTEAVVTEAAFIEGSYAYGLDILPISVEMDENSWWFVVWEADQLEPLDKPKQELGSWETLRLLGLDIETVKGEEAESRALWLLGLDVDAVRTGNLEKV
jgi:hypothetical protein